MKCEPLDPFGTWDKRRLSEITFQTATSNCAKCQQQMSLDVVLCSSMLIAVVGASETVMTCSSDEEIEILQSRPRHEMSASSWQVMAQNDRNILKRLSGPLSDAQIDDFFDDGFLILPEMVSAETLQDLQHDVESAIDRLADTLYRSNKTKSEYKESDWTQRLLQITSEYPDAPIMFMKRGILPPAFQRLFADQRFIAMAAQLGVGQDIALSPAWNIRSKMPNHEETVVPWHQDNSYWEPRIWDEPVLTFWVSLVDTDRENGCMQFIRGGQQSGITGTHTIGTNTKTWYERCRNQQNEPQKVISFLTLNMVTTHEHHS